jgi:23S rRNA (uracil1939-C5)-methyltransferase
MQLKKGEIIEIEIDALAFGGKGLGRFDGRAIFVEKVLPGDKVKVAFTRIKERFAEAELVEFIEKSAQRVDAKCRYSGLCGGCQMQELPYEKQLEFKKQQVIDSFERIGNISSPPVKDVIGCNEQFYYRNKMEFSFGYDANMEFALGMHVPGRRFDIMDLLECHLQSELSATILNTVRDFMIELGWPPYKVSCNEGFLKTLVIREGKRTGEIMINLKTSEHVPDDLKEGLSKFVEVLKGIDCGERKIVSIYWSKVISRRGEPKRIEETLLDGAEVLCEKMQLANGDSLEFEILPKAFFQVNTAQAEILYNEVLKLVVSEEREVVFDLFCGTGTIGLFLANYVKSVIGIEINEDSVKAAENNARKNNIFNVDFYVGDVTKALVEIKARPSIIVIDPPRPGMTKKGIEILQQFDSKQIIYVSCNPATLARDCDLLGDYGYKVKSVQPVDMFPHTHHIENVCLLER